MSAAGRSGKVLTGAMLITAVLAGAPADLYAQDRVSAGTRLWHRQSVEALRYERAVEEQRWELERARAHARMPSTMYASTPDPAPPHAFPLSAPSASPTALPPAPAASLAVSVARTHRIALFPSAARGSEGGYQGFARLINHSDVAGEVRIEAFDDEGAAHGPLTRAHCSRNVSMTIAGNRSATRSNALAIPPRRPERLVGMTSPYSAKSPRRALVCAVRNFTSWAHMRCSASTACCSSVLMATARRPGC